MVSNLQPGADYEFRVAAINNAGVGEFSSATMPVKVIDKDGGFLTVSIINLESR